MLDKDEKLFLACCDSVETNKLAEFKKNFKLFHSSEGYHSRIDSLVNLICSYDYLDYMQHICSKYPDNVSYLFIRNAEKNGAHNIIQYLSTKIALCDLPMDFRNAINTYEENMDAPVEDIVSLWDSLRTLKLHGFNTLSYLLNTLFYNNRWLYRRLCLHERFDIACDVYCVMCGINKAILECDKLSFLKFMKCSTEHRISTMLDFKDQCACVEDHIMLDWCNKEMLHLSKEEC